MSTLPDEITLIILSYLPIKSLLRFKCVSKPWRLLISSQNLKLSNQHRQGAITLMKYDTYTTKTTSFRLIKQQQLSLEEIKQQQLSLEAVTARFMVRENDENTPFMLRDFYEDSEIVCYKGTFSLLGSCDGLILISINKYIVLWNPATRLYNKVCDLDNNFNLNNCTSGGLCFDSSMNVYKAVLMNGEVVIVASLKGENKKWRQVEFPYGDMRSICDGTTLHGHVHYRVRVIRDDWCYLVCLCNEIICFDPVAEKFDMFPVPEPKFGRVENIIVGLGALNECLCMTRLVLVKGDVEVLVMKEYGAKESWTSLFVIRNLNIDTFHGAVVPLFMTDNGEFVSIINNNRDKNVLLYDPKNDETQDIQLVHGRKECISCSICYVESLISPQELLMEI